LIAGLAPGDEVLITQDERPVVRLIAETASPRYPRRPGSAQGRLLILAEDDEHLDDFQDYLSS
jgi:antitoxin (DNA-binding transcriptional repressor) of toxin-antitoxin stability system